MSYGTWSIEGDHYLRDVIDIKVDQLVTRCLFNQKGI